VPVLAEALAQCEDVLLCRLIILSLGKLRDHRAVQALLKHLPEVQNRREMVDALGDIGDAAATDALIARAPEQAAAAVRAIVKTQSALKADVARAAEVGKKLFPPSEAALIAELIRRDLPYCDAALSPAFVAGMTAFARGQGILDGDLAYEQVVATLGQLERGRELLRAAGARGRGDVDRHGAVGGLRGCRTPSHCCLPADSSSGVRLAGSGVR